MLCIDNIWMFHQSCENLLALKLLHDYGLNVSDMCEYGVYNDQEAYSGEDILFQAMRGLFGKLDFDEDEERAYEVSVCDMHCAEIEELCKVMDLRFLHAQFQSFSHTSSDSYSSEMFISINEKKNGFRIEFHELYGGCLSFIDTFIKLRKKVDQLATLLIARPKGEDTNGYLPCAV